MDVPLQIAFHRFDKPDWAEDEIRARVDKLTEIYDRITSCRVTVDQRANNVEGTIPPVVRIELQLPAAAPVVVAYEPDRLQRRFQTPELHNAIHDAFAIAERQLASRKAMRKEDVRDEHDSANQFLGQVAEIHPEEDHGFLMTKEGGLLYFHRNAMLSGSFDALSRGDAVHYVEEVGDTGPLATKVRVAG